MERRLAAVLIADVVGYGRLSQIDEEGTRVRFQADLHEIFQDKIAAHRGRLVKTMGDGLLVEFSSVVDAVRCAVEVQQEKTKRNADTPADRRLDFRIGINLGDVIVEGEDIHGDGVNIADRMQVLAEPGGVVISGTAYDQVKAKLPVGYVSLGSQRVKNIAEKVRVYRLKLNGPSHQRIGYRHIAGRGRWLAAVASILLIMVAGAAAWLIYPGPAPEDGKPSIAVLPFDNLGGDEATGRLADGITEDIITDLARFRELDVIARNSTFTYKGKSVNVRQAGKDLNVRYLLEGSIQRQADRVRVSAQLIDTRAGAHLWSDRWDRPIQDVFAVQTEVAERVVNALGPSSVLLRESVAAAKRKRPTDLQAYDLWALAYEAFLRGGEKELETALGYANAAIAKDPRLVRAYVKKAWILNGLAVYRKNWNEVRNDMEQLARTALAIDPYDAEAYTLLAFATSSLGRQSEAEVATDRALELNPSSADILNIAAINMPYFGRAEEGAALCDRAFRLNPNPPDWYYLDCVDPYFFARRFPDALDAIKRWNTTHDLYIGTLIYRAASLAELGQDKAAAAGLAELQKSYPKVSCEYLVNLGFTFERDQDRQLFLTSMRKAGIRLCATDQELREFASPQRLPECVTQ